MRKKEIWSRMSGHFNSMLATAMRLADGDAGSRAAAWRQIIDIVAQAGPLLAYEARGEAFERLGELRDEVPVADRRMAAASLAGRTSDPLITMLFARDLAAVAAPFLSRADLSAADWQQVIPAIPAAARNILRNRRDLPDPAMAALAYFAAADLTLPPSAVAARAEDAVAPGVTQIRDMVDRIAAYRQRVPMPIAAEPEVEKTPANGDTFLFETTAEGTIDWVAGVARAAIIGMTIAEPATFGSVGVDGQAAGAWRRRAPLRDARLLVGGLGSAGGNWLVSATPLFNPLDGRFCGYRGSARRPRPDEHVDGPFRSEGITPDSLRQLVHELRTPLNAIQGFAEMIDRQILGPAALRYRERARTIMVEAERLVTMVDDLDTSARLDTGRLPVVAAGETDLAVVAAQVYEAHRATLKARGVDLVALGLNAVMPAIAGSPIVERTMARLLAAVSAVATAGERITTMVEATSAEASFSVSRPDALIGRDDAELLDPGYGPDGDWPDAPLLGLGFTLRLVARLAAQAGGRLSILPDRFSMFLPLVVTRAEVRPA